MTTTKCVTCKAEYDPDDTAEREHHTVPVRDCECRCASKPRCYVCYRIDCPCLAH